MSGVDLGDTIDPLSAIHKALKAAHAPAIYREGPRAFGNARRYRCVTFQPTEHEQKATAAINVTAVLPFHKTLALNHKTDPVRSF
jgi:hypothetical protein